MRTKRATPRPPRTARRRRGYADSNQYFFRTHRRLPDANADIEGRTMPGALYRRGGTWLRGPSPSDSRTHAFDDELESSAQRQISRLRRAAARLLAECRLAGCTPTQIRTMDLLMQGTSLHEVAKLEGRTAAAIEARIQGLRWKAPRFFNGWRLAHRSRRRRD